MSHDVQVNFIQDRQQLTLNVIWEITMPNINRRRLLKALSAASAVAALPVGVNAASRFKNRFKKDRHTAVYIDTRHKQYKGSATRQICNRSNKPVVLNGYQPVTMRNAGGEYTSLYLNTPNTCYTLQPGERLPVYAQAVMTTAPATGQMQGILNNHSIAII